MYLHFAVVDDARIPGTCTGMEHSCVTVQKHCSSSSSSCSHYALMLWLCGAWMFQAHLCRSQIPLRQISQHSQ
jgi:hypothetical protein